MYTEAERRERRRACKIASDVRCGVRKTANARRYRKLKADAGLPSRGTPKAARLMPACVAERIQAQVAEPAQTYDEWLAQGGRVEVLPGCRYVPSRVMPYGARYGT